MSCRSGLAIGLLSSFLLTACYAQQGGLGFNGYGYGRAPLSASIPPPPPPPPPPAAEPPDAADAMALPPLILPIREDWSSEKCPGLAITFTGHSQAVQKPLAETASFQEARQVREGDYTEGAECFCTKSGNLSGMTEAAANSVMNRTARQFGDQLHMQVHAITFVEASPLGSYSELEASADEPSRMKAMLRVFWRGQCSVRVMVMSDPSTEARAAEFLQSLRNVKGEPKPAGGETKSAEAEMAAVPVPPVRKAALPSALVAPARSLPGTTRMDNDAGDSADADAQQSPDMDRAAALQSVAARLRQLQELKKDGLITKSEYDAKRQAIMNGL